LRACPQADLDDLPPACSITLLTKVASSASGQTALVIGPLSNLHRRIAPDLRIGFDHVVGVRGEGDSKSCLDLGMADAEADRPPPVAAVPSMLCPVALAPNLVPEIVAASTVLSRAPTPLDQPAVHGPLVDADRAITIRRRLMNSQDPAFQARPA
jgi:hypothetical protein